MVKGEEDYQSKEFNITVKQATNLLVKCKHDFRQFVSELLCVKQGTIAIRNLSFKVFDPTMGNYSQSLLNQNSSFCSVAASPHSNVSLRHPNQENNHNLGFANAQQEPIQ